MLLPPWSFVEFQIPTWQNMELCEPTAYGAIPVDLSIDGYDKESIVESNSYGESLIATAYQPVAGSFERRGLDEYEPEKCRALGTADRG